MSEHAMVAAIVVLGLLGFWLALTAGTQAARIRDLKFALMQLQTRVDKMNKRHQELGR